jgi:protein-tyrosine phosphatase
MGCRLMIDIHCHILPDTDDGASTWETAVDMCRMAVKDGIKHIVATPHANDEYDYQRSRHLDTLQRLQEAAGQDLTLSLGCDFHFSFDNIQDALAHRDRYVIGSTTYLLIELADFSIPPNMTTLLAQLMAAGMRPILTHPERNRILQKRPEPVLEWAREGCIVQVTANSLTGRWGDRALKAAHYLFKHDAVHVLASDAHNTHSRPPVLSAGREAAAKLVGRDVADALVEGNPGAIVNDRDLPYFPAPIMRR